MKTKFALLGFSKQALNIDISSSIVDEVKPKIFCFINSDIGTGRDRIIAVDAISEDGYFLARHYSSTALFAKFDIGLTNPDNCNHAKYKTHYPNGYELVWVPRKQIEAHSHTDLNAAYEKHTARLVKEDIDD